MKRLGQHFLNNRVAIRKIIDALEPKSDELIIEIGPGRGALTLPLMRACEKIGCKIVAIEKDINLVDWLIGKLVNWSDGIKIIKGDALKDLPKLINQTTNQLTNYKIVGNIPYYITGRLLRILSELEHKPKLAVLTIQKEVAERIVSKPPKMNLLAAITQFWAEPEIIGRLGPKAFSPPPKVDSAIIKLATGDWPLATSQGAYYKFIKIIFRQPRKTILNNLRVGLKLKSEGVSKILEKYGLSSQERPQNLRLETLINLSREFKN